MTKKQIFLLGGLVLVIVFVIFIIQTITSPNKLINTTPLIPSITPNYPIISPSDEKNIGFVVDWTKVQIINPINSYPIFHFQSLLETSNINKIANFFGFLDSQKQDLIGNYIWKTEDQKQIFLYTPKEKTLNYQLITNISSNAAFDEESIKKTVFDVLNNIFPSAKFSVKSITYLTKSLYSPPVSSDKAEIVKVDIDQLLGDYPLIPQTLASSNFATFFLNRDLSFSSFIINDGINNPVETSTKQIFSIDYLKKSPSTSFLNITSLPLDQQEIINKSSQVNYRVEKVEPAYISIKDTVSPVYLLSGKITPDKLPSISTTVQYIIPMR